MLSQIRLKDFKSFVDEKIELAPLTILVGTNASGKSNLFDAMRFVKGCARGLRIEEVFRGTSTESWPGIRGRQDEAARIGTRSFSIESEWVGPGPQRSEIGYDVTCAVDPPRLVSERIRVGGVSSHAGEALAGTIERSHLPSWASFSIDDLPDDAPRAFAGLAPQAAALQDMLWALTFLDIRADAMRDYRRKSATLSEDGANLSGVLAHLFADPDERDVITAWLVELCAPEIRELGTVETDFGDAMLKVTENGGRVLSARSMSDGTLHFLATLVALRTAAPGTTLFIEELGATVHPARLKLLVEYLEAATSERDVQVIATTHSPGILEWLGDDSLRNVVVFARVPGRDGTIARRLRDLPHFDVFRNKPGELFSEGWLELAV